MLSIDCMHVLLRSERNYPAVVSIPHSLPILLAGGCREDHECFGGGNFHYVGETVGLVYLVIIIFNLLYMYKKGNLYI